MCPVFCGVMSETFVRGSVVAEWEVNRNIAAHMTSRNCGENSSNAIHLHLTCYTKCEFWSGCCYFTGLQFYFNIHTEESATVNNPLVGVSLVAVAGKSDVTKIGTTDSSPPVHAKWPKLGREAWENWKSGKTQWIKKTTIRSGPWILQCFFSRSDVWSKSPNERVFWHY